MPTPFIVYHMHSEKQCPKILKYTPADNTRKRVWQYIEKEKKERKNLTIHYLFLQQ